MHQRISICLISLFHIFLLHRRKFYTERRLSFPKLIGENILWGFVVFLWHRDRRKTNIFKQTQSHFLLPPRWTGVFAHRVIATAAFQKSMIKKRAARIPSRLAPWFHSPSSANVASFDVTKLNLSIFYIYFKHTVSVQSSRSIFCLVSLKDCIYWIEQFS